MSTIACPICGRRIPTSGASHPPTQCPTCGASLLASDQTPGGSRDDSDTRPIPLDQFPTKPVPPTPTPAPTDGETRDLPASALSQTPPRGAGRGLARGLSMAALVALLLAIVAIAALVVNGALPLAQQTASPTATAPAPSPSATPATIPYAPAGLYSIAYPTGWTKTEQNYPPTTYSATFINPRGGASLTVTLRQTPSLIDPASYDTNYLNALAFTTNSKPTNRSKPQAVTLAGQTWTAESADVAILTAAGKQYAHAVAMTLNYHGYAYTIVRLVPCPDKASAKSAFDTAEQGSFQPMLATFAFPG